MIDQRRRLLAVVVLAVVASLGAWILARRGNRGVDARRPAVQAAPASGAPGRTVDLWPVGATASYVVTMRIDVTASGEPVLGLVVHGLWKISAFEYHSQKLVHALLQSVELANSTGSASDAETMRLLRKGLEEYALFSVSNQGTVQEVRLSPETPAFDQGVLKSLIAFAQFTRNDGRSTSWSAEEEDTTGTYAAAYAAFGSEAYARTKTRYLRVLGGSQQLRTAGVGTDIVSSKCDFAFSGAGNLRMLTCHEQTRVRGGGAGPLPALEGHTEMSLVWKQSEALKTPGLELGRLWDATPPSKLYDPPTNGGAHLETDIARTRGLTLSNALAKLGASHNAGPSGERSRLYSGIATILRKDPIAVEAALGRIRGNDAQASLLTDALGDAGSAASQRALADLAVDAKLDAEARRRALIDLSLVRTPSEETARFLASRMDDPVQGTQARYGLGTAIHNLKNTAPTAASEALNGLLERLDTDDDRGRAADLVALGNAGSPSSLDAIAKYLGDSQPLVRSAAVNALRRISEVRADEYLATALISDPSPLVRESAIQAIDEREPAGVIVAALDRAARTEPDLEIRSQILRVTARWASARTVLLGTLSWVAVNDENEQLRAVAKANLGRITGTG